MPLNFQDEFTQRYNIDKLVWDDIHAGPAPVFPQTHRIKSDLNLISANFINSIFN